MRQFTQHLNLAVLTNNPQFNPNQFEENAIEQRSVMLYDKIQHYQVVSSIFDLQKNTVAAMDSLFFGTWTEAQFFGISKNT